MSGTDTTKFKKDVDVLRGVEEVVPRYAVPFHKYSNFFDGYVPPFSHDYIQFIADDIKDAREPEWSLEGWSKYDYKARFPELREAIFNWCGNVESGVLTSSGVGESRNDGRPDMALVPFPNGCQMDSQGDAIGALTREQLEILFDKSTARDIIELCLARTSDAETCDRQSKLLDKFQSLPRVEASKLSKEEFFAKFEEGLQPCMLSGIGSDWNMSHWTAASISEGKYKEALFKVGKTPNGYRTTMKFKHFIQYMYSCRDDLPLYLFESQVDRVDSAENMYEEYVIPEYFNRDLYKVEGISKNRTPPNSWLTIGAQGSGTTMHFDQGGTIAFNAIPKAEDGCKALGLKYWVCLAADVTEDIATAANMRVKKTRGYNVGSEKRVCGPPDTQMMQGWCWNALPKLREFVARSENLVLYEVLQFPGDCIYVPGGVWHAVLNLVDSVAYTSNYVWGADSFRVVYREIRESRKHMVKRWLQALMSKYPELVEIAKDMDAADNFVPVYNKRALLRKELRAKRLAIIREATLAGVSHDESEHSSDVLSDGAWDSSTVTEDETGSEESDE